MINNKITRIEKRLREYEKTTEKDQEREVIHQIIADWNQGIITPVTFLTLTSDKRIRQIIRERMNK
jgi:hypothetical protein